ncbi:hypothetical protein F4819DRAFT_303566 [Hypoxylon fuscum]|nr:hypothetical protein F4819DRAFT_303566 [Hypoxylon fuscum]
MFRAIEGVGSGLRQQTGNPFSHGILGGTLLPSLLWESKEHLSPDRCPSWHWSSSNSRKTVDDALYIYESREYFICLPLAYPFLSDSCEDLATSESKDFWPNLLCIGRILEPRSLGLELGSLNMKRYLYQEGDVFLPLVVQLERQILEVTKKARYGLMMGLHLRKSSCGTFRRISYFRNMYGGPTTPEVAARIAQVKPQLIIII